MVGTALCAAPALAGGWIGRDARSRGAQVVIRAFGVRDAALGLGVLASAHHSGDLRRWLIASTAADVADFGATLGADPGAGRTAVLALAAGSACAGLALTAMTGS
jgi:hypothetical protein